MAISAESAPEASAGPGLAVRSLSLLVPGSFTDEDPYQGLGSPYRRRPASGAAAGYG